MATWPSTLPQYLEQDGFSIQQQDQVIRTPTDVGPVKIRRRFSAAVSKVQGQITITSEQYTILMDFLITTVMEDQLLLNGYTLLYNQLLVLDLDSHPSLHLKLVNIFWFS